jgi:xylan 1,4-beta-xylosidase
MKAQRRILSNPVIRGFAPDPSIVRVDDWYYVATSSFEWFPTIPIHRSRDLVDWEFAGSVETAAPGRSLVGVPDSGGIWAPALSYADGHYWVVYSILRNFEGPSHDLETYLCTAESVDGPWSPPIRVSGYGFDPALFHHEGRHYLLNVQCDSRPGRDFFAGIVLIEIDDAGARAGGPVLLLQHQNLIEGPKLLVHDGWFYLSVAEGGTGVEHGSRVTRSRELWGPYEWDDRDLLTSRDDTTVALQKAGHSEFVQSPGGEWFLAHLATRMLETPAGPRGPLGRETAIQAVTFADDGWPRLAGGGHHPFLEVSVPAEPGAAAGPVATALGWPWSSLRGGTEGWADVAGPDTIRLRGRQSPTSVFGCSLLAQRIPELHATVEVTVDAHPDTFTQGAGLALWYNASSYFLLDVTWAEPEGEAQRGQQWTGGGRTVLRLSIRDATGLSTETVRGIGPGPVRLRATIDGAVARFWAGVPGDELQTTGPELDFSQLSEEYGGRLRFTGAFAGILAYDLVDAAFTADFSGFSLTARSE